MKTEVLIVLLAIALSVVLFASWARAQSQDVSRSSEGSVDEASALETVAKARADIKEFGWHVVAVQNDERPGVLYTVGLWESYRHPEILVFAPSQDPMTIAKNLSVLASRVAKGESVKHGDVLEGAFGKFPGAIRNVHPKWHPGFLGTAGGVYGHFDFPAVQLFWPDSTGLFPWQSGFNSDISVYQPLLEQSNVILANVGYDAIVEIFEQESGQQIDQALADLLLDPGVFSESDVDVLADWRWRIGDDAQLYGVTLFGDVFLQTPDGHIHWLDTGSDSYEEVATDRETWLRILPINSPIFFHASTLLHFRSLGFAPKEEGSVYSWIQPPILGGEDTVDNFDTVSAVVHLSNSGRTAKAVEGGGQPESGGDTDDGQIYAVVINAEKQYSMWPVDREIPSGWESVGRTGTKQECLDYIESVWTDMRPESLRKKREDEAKEGQVPG